MNESGSAVKGFYDKYELKLENTLIIYDDINLDFGVIRMRPSGSDGGQNGIKSIIYEMETEEIPRLRIGIRNDEELEKWKLDDGYNLAGYVLSDFTKDEQQDMDKLTAEVKDAVLLFVEQGISETMNKYNKRVSGKSDLSGTSDISGENNN
jgi:PTH1 family peptidyl-tRNA hydrolase